jgi:hypothetical protein
VLAAGQIVLDDPAPFAARAAFAAVLVEQRFSYHRQTLDAGVSSLSPRFNIASFRVS